jgi:hypothetical protein
MNLLPAGHVKEVLAGAGPGREEVQRFLRYSHHQDSHDGVSYAAVGVLACGMVWVLAGPDADDLASALRDADAVDAEVLELRNLQ